MSTPRDAMINGGRSLTETLNLFGNPAVPNISLGTHDIPHCTNDIRVVNCTPRCTAQTICRVTFLHRIYDYVYDLQFQMLV